MPLQEASPNPEAQDRSGVFLTTHWSVVLAAGDRASPQAEQSLESLCRTYWRPLYAYVRRRGHDTHDAQDLVQTFFERVIEKNYLAAADRQRGRFRTFLLASLEHFLAKEWTRAHRLKRGGGHSFVPINADDAELFYRAEPADELSPEKLYDRSWALTLLEQALAKLRDEYTAGERGRVFEELVGVLSGDKPKFSYREIGVRLDLTEGAVKVAVHRLRQRYGELVRAEIADTLARPELVEEELRHLFAALAA